MGLIKSIKKRWKRLTYKPIKDNGLNNKILYEKHKDSLWLNIKVFGDNNEIIIKKPHKETKSLNISIYGDNCKVVIGEGLFSREPLYITMGQNHKFHGKIHNTQVEIGKNVWIEQAKIATFNSNNKISIGDNCMISSKVYFYNTDGHPIYDKDTEKLVNYVSDMTIGANCWIGYGATILKGVKLPNWTIVGWGSVVSKSIQKENCALAGNPARIVKEGLKWSRGGDMEYIENLRGRDE